MATVRDYLESDEELEGWVGDVTCADDNAMEPLLEEYRRCRDALFANVKRLRDRKPMEYNELAKLNARLYDASRRLADHVMGTTNYIQSDLDKWPYQKTQKQPTA